jgi:hypothetical protein
MSMTERMHTFLLVSAGPDQPQRTANARQTSPSGALAPITSGSRHDGQASRPKAMIRDAIIGGSGWTSLLGAVRQGSREPGLTRFARLVIQPSNPGRTNQPPAG